jgi:hypothetical protein
MYVERVNNKLDIPQYLMQTSTETEAHTSIYLTLPATLGPVVYPASKRNEYQKQKNNISGGVDRGRCVGLTNLSSSVSPLFKQCGILNISKPYRPPLPITGIALLLLEISSHLNSRRKIVAAASLSPFALVQFVISTKLGMKTR